MKKIINSLAFLLLLCTFTSCVKNDIVALTNQGSTFIKLLEAPENNLFFSPFTDVKTVDLFSIRKDPSSKEEFNKATTITLLSVPTYIERYNDANGTSFDVLPDSLFTLDNAFVKSGDKYTVTLAAGKFSKEFTIKLNGAKWDISHTYAVAFALSDVSGKKISKGADTIIATVSIKNEYDGTYTMRGYTLRATDAVRTGFFKGVNMELHTQSPNGVMFASLQVWADLTGVGIGYPELTVNPDNSVDITSSGGARNAPDYKSYYDPALKTFYISFTWGAGPAARLAIDTLVYKGPR